MSALGVSRQIIVSQWLPRNMIDDMRDAICKELFVVFVAVVVVVVVSFLWNYLYDLGPESFAIYK